VARTARSSRPRLGAQPAHASRPRSDTRIVRAMRCRSPGFDLIETRPVAGCRRRWLCQDAGSGPSASPVRTAASRRTNSASRDSCRLHYRPASQCATTKHGARSIERFLVEERGRFLGKSLCHGRATAHGSQGGSAARIGAGWRGAGTTQGSARRRRPTWIRRPRDNSTPAASTIFVVGKAIGLRRISALMRADRRDS
jgi:hypothetical protein